LGAPECAYYGTGDDYFDHQNYGNFSPTLLANFPGAGSGSFSPIPQTQDSPVVDGSNLGGQYSSTWQDSNLYLLDGGRDDFLGSPVAELYDRPSNPHPGFDGALVTPIVSNEAAVLEHINSLPPHPAGMVGNQRVTQVPAESPALPVANEKLGIQYSGKRKRSASPDGRPKKKRARRKPRQEQTQVCLIGIYLTQKGIVTTVVLDGSRCHALAHTPRFPRCATDHVRIRKRAELEMFASDRIHGLPRGRGQSRRDQPRRRLESTL